MSISHGLSEVPVAVLTCLPALLVLLRVGNRKPLSNLLHLPRVPKKGGVTGRGIHCVKKSNTHTHTQKKQWIRQPVTGTLI